MKKVMISVAPVSAADKFIDPDQIAEDVFECYKNGASMVHLHVRNQNGQLTSDMTLLNETVEKIRSNCDIVIEISTGGVSNLNIRQRCEPCYAPYVEAASLNVGSVNLGEAVYQNPINDVKYCVDKILRNGKVPEIEVFELGMIHTVKKLTEEFDFINPILFALVFGHDGEMPATPAAIDHMVGFLYENFDRADVLWGYTEANRRDWNMVRYAIDMGASSIRIGFEDSDYLSSSERVTSNAPLIAEVAQIVRNKGRVLMTPYEVRELLKIPQL